MIQFQFSDSHVFNFNPNEILKLREPNDRLKHLFSTDCRNKIEQWEIVYDLKTYQPKSLRFVKSLPYKKPKCSAFHVEKSNILVSNDRHIYVLDIENGKMDKMAKANLYCVKFYSNRLNKKFLLGVSETTGNFKVWDWETKQLVKTENTSKNLSSQLEINEQTQELIGITQDNAIEIWCLETFTLKRRILLDTKATMEFLCLSFSKELFVMDSAGLEIQVWDKRREKFIHIIESDIHSYSFAICSVYLNLVVYYYSSSKLKIWEFDIGKPQLKEFVISNPFNLDFVKVKFLDPNTQTQILAIDYGSNILVVDLLSKTIIKKIKGPDNSFLLGSIL